MDEGRTTHLPALPCPECRQNGKGGGARIGNQRRKCRTCNTFARNLDRLLVQRLKANHPEESAQLRLRIEADLYPQIIEDFSKRGAL